jgi:hypothetical protein
MTPRSESFETYVASLASGAVHVIGPNGDDDPGHALEQLVISNTGTTAIRVASSLTGVQGTRYLIVPAGSVVPVEGPRDALIIKTNTAAASTFSVTGEAFYRNSARDGGVRGAKGNPGVLTRYRSGRLAFTANTANVTTTARFKSAATLSAIKLYAGTAPSGATITLTVTDLQGRNLLTAASFDLETLVGGTLTSLTLTTSTDLLALGRNGGVIFKVTSTDPGDTCSVAFELVYEGE